MTARAHAAMSCSGFIFLLSAAVLLLLCCCVRSTTAQVSIETQYDIDERQDTLNIISTNDLKVTYYFNSSTNYRIDFLIDGEMADPPIFMNWNTPALRELDAETFDVVTEGNLISSEYVYSIYPDYYFFTITDPLNITTYPDLVDVPNTATYTADVAVLTNNHTFDAIAPGAEKVFVPKDGFKYSFGFREWPFQNPNTVLEQRITTQLYPPTALDTSRLDDPVHPAITVVHHDRKHKWIINFQRVCRLNATDATLAPADFSWTNPLPGRTLISIKFAQSDYIYYDPDIQALLDGDSGSGEGDGDGDGNSDTVAIAVGVTVPVVVVVACCILIVGIAIGVWAGINRRKAASGVADNL